MPRTLFVDLFVHKQVPTKNMNTWPDRFCEDDNEGLKVWRSTNLSWASRLTFLGNAPCLIGLEPDQYDNGEDITGGYLYIGEYDSRVPSTSRIRRVLATDVGVPLDATITDTP